MGKKIINKKKSKNDSIDINFTNRKKLCVNLYKNKAYLHLNDNFSKKTFTLDRVETKKFMTKLPKLLKYMKKLESSKESLNNSESSCDSDTEKDPIMSDCESLYSA